MFFFYQDVSVSVQLSFLVVCVYAEESVASFAVIIVVVLFMKN